MPVRGREPRLLGAASNYLTAPKSRPGTGFSISAVEQPKRGAVAWKVGSAESLPVDQGSFDRAVLSLVLHQLANPKLAVAEALRALAADGRVVIRTITPADVAARVPYRFFPLM